MSPTKSMNAEVDKALGSRVCIGHVFFRPSEATSDSISLYKPNKDFKSQKSDSATKTNEKVNAEPKY